MTIANKKEKITLKKKRNGPINDGNWREGQRDRRWLVPHTAVGRGQCSNRQWWCRQETAAVGFRDWNESRM